MPDGRPQYKKGSGSDELAQGGAKSLNDASRSTPTGKDSYPGQFAQPKQQGGSSAPTEPSYSGDLTGMDNWLFGRETDRPAEPVSAGAPWGEGSNFLRLPGEDDRGFKARVADVILRDPNSSSQSRMLAAKMLEG